MGKDADELRQEIAETRERMGETADAIAYKADVPHRLQDKVGEKVDQMKSAITGTVSQARQAVSNATGKLPDTGDVRDSAMSAVDAVQRNPLGLFFGMAAVGFMIGSLLPVTDFETENVKPMVDQLKDRAVDQVQGTIDKAKDAAVSAVSSSMGSQTNTNA
ncbi:MAG TPA: DUF3618 domain-containing protein [Candidatus Aquilonibacter sp.]|nr:DUF3618 domain-containing protein [Candidatus Aquilonibacter sp.]